MPGQPRQLASPTIVVAVKRQLGQDKDNRERGQDKDKGLGQATVRDIRPHPPRLQQEGSPRA